MSMFMMGEQALWANLQAYIGNNSNNNNENNSNNNNNNNNNNSNNNEERVMHSSSNNLEIMINDEADEVIKQLFDSLENRYQNNLESMKDSDFAFDYVNLLYYKCHKINPNRCGSYFNYIG